MKTSKDLPQPVLIPRRITGALIDQLGLPLNELGAPFVLECQDAAAAASVAQWWEARSPAEQKTLQGGIAILAAPQILTDIRICFQQKSQTRTWALASGAAAEAPWIFFAPLSDDNDFHVQLAPSRETVVNSFMVYLQAGSPVWDSAIRFCVSVPEFAVLIALADVYTRSQYAALLRHQPYPTSLPQEDVLSGYDNVTQVADQRFLYPAITHLLPEEARAIGRDAVPGMIQKLAERGLLQLDGANVGWTDGGLFFADSLHRRIAALALDIAGATAQGAMATQGALFVRGDQVLWFCDIEPSATGSVSVVSVSVEKAREILDEILKPVGSPPMRKAGKAAARQAGASPQPAAVAAAKAAPAFCSSCGSPLQPGARFCAKCGTPVGKG